MKLRMITPKRLRCIGWLQRRALLTQRTVWATCTSVAIASLETALKRCGGGGKLPPKDIRKQYIR
jgi:hypothetical protein